MTSSSVNTFNTRTENPPDTDTEDGQSIDPAACDPEVKPQQRLHCGKEHCQLGVYLQKLQGVLHIRFTQKTRHTVRSVNSWYFITHQHYMINLAIIYNVTSQVGGYVILTHSRRAAYEAA